MNYAQHRSNWNECTCCSLCLTRKHVVLARGNIPADILCVAEAPGMSEDILGQPLVGPAGKLFDQIIAKSKRGRSVKFAYTNLIACIPVGADGKKAIEPEKEHIEACRVRLEEFIDLCDPKAIIRVGKLADQYIECYDYPQASVVHPAAILRADLSQQGLLVQNCVVTISDMIEEIGIE